MISSKIILGDSKEKLKELESDSVDLMVTDPPYGYSFMGKNWDKVLPDIEIFKEALRVLKPGAFSFVMSAPRADVQYRMIELLEKAGFNVGFTPIYWAYATGFPKSSNISKMVDKRLGVERKIISPGTPPKEGFKKGVFDNRGPNSFGNGPVTESATPEAKELDGSYAGYQPKPAVEVVIVAMKPLSEKSYVDQAMKDKKGITWLDDVRIPLAGTGEDKRLVEGGSWDTSKMAKNVYEGGYAGIRHSAPMKRKKSDYEAYVDKMKSFKNAGAGGFSSDSHIYGDSKHGENPSERYQGMDGMEPAGRFPANLICSDDVLNDKNISQSSIKYHDHQDRNIYGNYSNNGEVGYGYDEGKYLSYFDKFLNQEPYLDINEIEWAYIIETFVKEDVKRSLAQVAMTYPPPYKMLTRYDAYKEYMKLKGVRWRDILVDGEWFPRGEYKYDISYKGKQQYFKTSSHTGNSASNYFQQKNRWEANSNYPGPVRTWSSEPFMFSLMSALYTLPDIVSVNQAVLRRAIALRKYICSQFKPSVAKSLYDMFGAKDVLDFSAGWGDRLAGFYASDASSYVGIDPNKKTFATYKEQSAFYEKHNGFFEVDKIVEFANCPAEEYEFGVNIFDFVFTSPPYFDTERYSTDDTQSWVRYKKIDDWNENFMNATIRNLWPAIKSGGHLLINISDVIKNGKWLPICDPMIDFILTLKGAEYLGCIGMGMTARLNNIEAQGDKTFGEPIWIIRKNAI